MGYVEFVEKKRKSGSTSYTNVLGVGQNIFDEEGGGSKQMKKIMERRRKAERQGEERTREEGEQY